MNAKANAPRKLLRPPRDAARTLAAVLATATLVACGPADRAAGPRAELADGVGGSARVITTVHVVQPGALVATVGYADTTQAPVVVTGGSGGVDLGALPAPRPRPTSPADEVRLYDRVVGGSGATLEIARDGRRPSRQGVWTRDVRLQDGRAAKVEFEAAGGAPMSRITLTSGGEVVLEMRADWRRSGDVWTLGSRTTSVFRAGRAIAWTVTSIEAPALRTASAADRFAAATMAAGRRGVLAVADALSPPALLAQGIDGVGSGPCAKQQEAVYDAESDLVVSGLLVVVAAATSNPFALAAATVNFVRSAQKTDVAQERLLSCQGQ